MVKKGIKLFLNMVFEVKIVVRRLGFRLFLYKIMVFNVFWDIYEVLKCGLVDS